MMIPYADLRAQYRAIKPEIDAAIAHVLENAQFILGPAVSAFEAEFAQYTGTNAAIGLNSGTSALHLALLAAGVGPGDEVITVPFTFVATVAAIGYCGATPVFVDIDPVSFTMDVTQIEAAITPRTKAILPVHLFGQPADMDPIMEIAGRHNLIVIEDAAQAIGAEYKGRRAGSIGQMGCFSFYPGKNLGAYGEGGAVVTSNPEYEHKIRLLRDWGSEKRYVHQVKAFNYRMEGIQGAILGVKLRHLEAWTEARRTRADEYAGLLADSGVAVPRAMPYARHVWHVYSVRTPNRPALEASLRASEIQYGIHYPIPLHLQPAWSDLNYGAGDFPQAEKAANEVLALPIYPELTLENMRVIAGAVQHAGVVRV